jgi:hypothetical protein
MVGARERKVIPKSIVSALAQISLMQTFAGTKLNVRNSPEGDSWLVGPTVLEPP